MTLAQRLTLLAQAIGTDVKTLNTTIGSMASLSTASKATLVGAINEVFTLANSGGGTSIIDDAATNSTTKVYSVNKVLALVATLKAEILGGVPTAAFDTIKEIADYIASDQTASSGFITSLGLRVRVDALQSFDSTQKQQARTNIDAYGSTELGNPDTDLASLYITAKA